MNTTYNTSVNLALQSNMLRLGAKPVHHEESILVSDTNSKATSLDHHSTHTSQYQILRTLPNYTLGDTLRKEDLLFFSSMEATAYAMDKLSTNDCVFILRSCGKWTYATYNGPIEGVSSTSMSFQVDEDRRYKVIPQASFCKVVKVPSLPISSTSSSGTSPRRAHRKAFVVSHPTSSNSRNNRPAHLSSSLPPIKIEEAMGITTSSSTQTGVAPRRAHRRAFVARPTHLSSSLPPIKIEEVESVTTSSSSTNQSRVTAGSSSTQKTRDLPSSAPQSGMITQIDIKTEDDTSTKTVPLYRKGMDVIYKGRPVYESARIVDVHLDDLLEPYYTIRLADGREKQTDNDHIKIEPLFWC